MSGLELTSALCPLPSALRLKTSSPVPHPNANRYKIDQSPQQVQEFEAELDSQLETAKSRIEDFSELGK